jgi:site-specific DNA-cytosine methylase
MAKNTMKRPAASSSPVKKLIVKNDPSSSSDKTKNEPTRKFTHKKFCLNSFLNRATSFLNLAARPSTRAMLLATGCSGSGAPTFVARALLQNKVEVNEIWAAESSSPKAHFLITHCHPKHVFRDVSSVAEDARGPCFVHGGAACDVPSERPDLLWGGFVCKGNSMQNAGRFRQDNIVPEGNSKNLDTFYALRRSIVRHNPRVAVLENVVGILSKRGGGIDTTTSDFIESDATWGLKNIPGYSYSRVAVSGHDGLLPTRRERIWFIMVADDTGDAQRVADRASNLVTYFSKYPLHHIESCRSPTTQDLWPKHPYHDDQATSDVVAKHNRTAAYASQVAACLQSCVKVEALPSDWAMSPPQHRPSERIDPQVQIPPYYRASMDIVSEVIRASAVAGSAKRYSVADVSQSINRMKIKYDGECPTLTTTSRIVDVGAGLISAGSSSSSLTTTHSPAWFSPHEMMAIHGFDPQVLNMTTMTWFEGLYLAGEGMALPTLAIIMVPCIAELGFLTAVSNDKD